MRISDWSSDVCSSDLPRAARRRGTTTRCRRARPPWRRRRPAPSATEIGRASCGARVCPYVSISVVAVSVQQQHNQDQVNLITTRLYHEYRQTHCRYSTYSTQSQLNTVHSVKLN